MQRIWWWWSRDTSLISVRLNITRFFMCSFGRKASSTDNDGDETMKDINGRSLTPRKKCLNEYMVDIEPMWFPMDPNIG